MGENITDNALNWALRRCFVNISTEKLLSRSVSLGEMRFFGVSAFFDDNEERAFAVGKLFDHRLFESSPEASAILFFSSSAQLTYALPKLKKSAAVGIVVSARALPDKTIKSLIAFSLPFLIIEKCDDIAELCCGNVAILDARRGRLTVNPTLGTIKSYSISSSSHNNHNSFADLHGSCGIRISKGSNDSMLISVSKARHEGELFSLLQTLTEGRLGRRITVSLKLACGGYTEERFCDDVEAVFLAALYGSISILLDGYHSAVDIDRALSLIKCSFCRLEGNRREFNGCLKKGLMISAPIWLTADLPMQHPDVICLELDTLARRALGYEANTTPDDLEVLEDLLCDFTKRHRHIPLAATLSASAKAGVQKSALALCEAAGIQEVYF